MFPRLRYMSLLACFCSEAKSIGLVANLTKSKSYLFINISTFSQKGYACMREELAVWNVGILPREEVVCGGECVRN